MTSTTALKPGQMWLPEFDQEMAGARKVLERVPDGKFDWKPHEKSGTLGWLASHVAHMPMWAVATLTTDVLDLAGPNPDIPKPANRQELLNLFDVHLSRARKLIEDVTPETLNGAWTLRAGGREIFTMPRAAVLRGFVMNHLIHHRAQLTVYLRLLDVPVPGIYGPTADEPNM